jgi:hypothetical protein
MATKPSTPARRARARRDPAIFAAPPRVKGDRKSTIRNLSLRSLGRVYPIGGAVDGSTPWGFGMDQTGTFTLPVRDVSGKLVEILGDESHLQQVGVSCVLDGVVYMVAGVDHDGEGLYTLTFEDETSWRMKLFSSYRSASRARTTRFGFILSFIDEASRKPYARIRSFIPEVDDKQPIRKAKRRP